MLLRHSLGLEEEAKAVENAVHLAVVNGARSADLGGSLRTQEMTERVLRELKKGNA